MKGKLKQVEEAIASTGSAIEELKSDIEAKQKELNLVREQMLALQRKLEALNIVEQREEPCENRN